MEALIRIGTADDVEVVFDIRTSVRENHLSREQMAALGITPETAREEMSTSTTSRTWIAEVDGFPVGFAVAHADDGSVFALFVRAESEGQGIGRRLMQEAEAFLFRTHPRIWLETDGKSRASRFYREQGWEPVAELDDGDVRFEKAAGGQPDG